MSEFPAVALIVFTVVGTCGIVTLIVVIRWIKYLSRTRNVRLKNKLRGLLKVKRMFRIENRLKIIITSAIAIKILSFGIKITDVLRCKLGMELKDGDQ